MLLQAPVHRWRLTVAYNGTQLHGWQRQTAPPQRTAQAELEHAVRRLTGQPAQVHGAGRTDAGVHARGQRAHLDLQVPRAWRAAELRRGLNAMLEQQAAPVRVLQCARALADFHVRADALQRTYVYRLVCGAPAHQPHPLFDAAGQWLLPAGWHLDPAQLHVTAQLLQTTTRWAALVPAPPPPQLLPDPWPVQSVEVRRCPGPWLAPWGELAGCPEAWEVEVRARAFQRRQVRGMVGALVAVAAGRLALHELARLLELGTAGRGLAPPPAPPHGLYLEWVRYAPERLALPPDASPELHATEDPT